MEETYAFMFIIKQSTYSRYKKTCTNNKVYWEEGDIEWEQKSKKGMNGYLLELSGLFQEISFPIQSKKLYLTIFMSVWLVIWRYDDGGSGDAHQITYLKKYSPLAILWSTWQIYTDKSKM